MLVKKQIVFSFVLAMLSFVATKTFESYGVNQYYRYQADHFVKENGYFDLQHPAKVQLLPVGILPFSHIAALDSSNLIGMQANGSNGLIVLNPDSSSFYMINPLAHDVKLTAFVKVDTSLYLFDDRMQVYATHYPFDSSSTSKISEKAMKWKASSACYHAATHRIYFNQEITDPEVNRMRSVYAFNVNKNQYASDPLFVYDVDAIEHFATENGIRIHANRITALNDTVLGLTINPTAIAVHPKTNEVYILSGIDHSLVVFNQYGDILNYSELDPNIFPNPSGLAFTDSGDILISNEDMMKNSIVRVSWNKLFQSKQGKGLVFGR